MSYGLEFNAEIFIKNKDFQENKHQLNDEIFECEKYINLLKSKIKMYASCNVSDVTPEDWNQQGIDWLSNEMESLLESLDESSYLLYQLKLYKEYLKEKQEKGGQNRI